MIPAVAALIVALAPAPQPDPPPSPGLLIPSYAVNPDGTRMQCTPNASYCWPDDSGLPSYLQGS